MKAILGALFLAVCSSSAFTQGSPAWQSFYPYHKGDIRQYRSVYTGEITHTQYTDSVAVDPLTKDQFIFGRNVSGSTWPTEYRIDSSGNLYNMGFQPDYVRYKLYADSGDSWIGGYVTTDSTRAVRVTVQYTYNALIFGVLAKVKVFRFEFMNSSGSWFWVGNDHLAADFGLVKEDVEPSDVYAISGAVIDAVPYGVIDAIHEAAVLGRVPTSFVLEQNYPNPFNPSTTIRYALPRRSHVSLCVFNTLGEGVAELVHGQVEAGFHEVHFDAHTLPSGVYFYRLSAEDFLQTKRLVLVR